MCVYIYINTREKGIRRRKERGRKADDAWSGVV